MQQRMQEGRETSRSLVDKYLARIDAIDQQGPSLRSVLEINPDAQAIADALDVERRTKGPRGPLHGIPILLKDNIDTADRMMTTAGSLALVGARPAADAFLVTRLRRAGAVILGKTNMSEWANFRSTHSSSGWSGRGGQTRSPYLLDHNPSGSSSGSAVAIAANLAVAAVGTETDGSIVSPAHRNNLVGIKPTVGLVSRSGIIPLAHSQDTAGPMARTVTDAALLLTVIAGRDPDDDAHASARVGRRNYAAALDARALRGARIGVVRDRFFGYNSAVDALANAAIAVMQAQGATVIDPANIDTLGEFGTSEIEVLQYEFKADLDKFLARLGPASPVHSLADVIRFNDAHSVDELPYFGQELMIASDLKGSLHSSAYKTALAHDRQQARRLGIDAVMKKYRLDALVAPTGGQARPIDLLRGDFGAPNEASPSTVAAVAGYPHITVPMGFVGSLPVGISFFGRAWSEPTLIRLAYAYEQATHHRRSPTFGLAAQNGALAQPSAFAR